MDLTRSLAFCEEPESQQDNGNPICDDWSPGNNDEWSQSLSTHNDSDDSHFQENVPSATKSPENSPRNEKSMTQQNSASSLLNRSASSRVIPEGQTDGRRNLFGKKSVGQYVCSVIRFQFICIYLYI